jgi:hypothetical protein
MKKKMYTLRSVVLAVQMDHFFEFKANFGISLLTSFFQSIRKNEYHGKQRRILGNSVIHISYPYASLFRIHFHDFSASECPWKTSYCISQIALRSPCSFLYLMGECLLYNILVPIQIEPSIHSMR